MLKTEYFWTDRDQANERLTGSFVIHDNSVVYIHEIRAGRAGPKAVVTRYPTATSTEIALSDPGFNRFRVPLPLGWVNNTRTKRACFLARRPVRSRTHGFNNNNINVASFGEEMRLIPDRDLNFTDVAKDSAYQSAITGKYPPLDLVLNKIRKSTAVSFCPEMCVARDKDGIRWLYFNTDCVGLFVDADTILLKEGYTYLKEQLTESPAFNVSNIKEF